MSDISSSTDSDTDFIRLGLRDTRNGEIKPELLLAEWLNTLDLLRAALEKSPPGELSQLLEILAVAGRFRRTTFPETDPTVQDRLTWADRITGQLHQSDCEKAIQFLSHKNFLEDAKRLWKNWSDDLVDHQEAVRKAIAILRDWDDSGIILARLGERFDIPNSDIGKTRSEFLTWLCTEGDSILLLASNWVQTMSAAFDPELADKHPELDVSTQGYVFLLDALEEIEKVMDCHPDWIAAKIEGLAEYLQTVPPPTIATPNRSLEPANKKRYLTFIGTALSLFIAATALFVAIFHGGKRDSIADARVSWLAKDFEPQPSTAKSATSHEGADETETRQKEYETRMSKTPKNVDLLLEYGRFLLRQKRAEEAVTIFEKAGRQAPDNPYVPLGLGIAAVLQKNDTVARGHFEEAIEKAKTEPWAQVYAHINAADCCMRLEKDNAAATAHRRAALALIDGSSIADDLVLGPRIEKLREDVLYELHRKPGPAVHGIMK